MLGIIDTGIANINSIRNISLKAGFSKISIVQSPQDLCKFSQLVLPGIGSWDAGVRSLMNTGMFEELKKVASAGMPLIGVCLGMQLLLEGSEEGELPGLGLIPGVCKKFNTEESGRIPHMGWNKVRASSDKILFPNDSNQKYYFVHSYYCDVPRYAVAYETFYGRWFTSAIQHKNILGCQFHPEKSHKYGLNLLKSFKDWRPNELAN
jgi:imidazole glycerol-phosphate synthase subunit HisH